MAAILQLKPITGVPDSLRYSAKPRDPVFFQDPYAFYGRLHAENPSFFWEEYGHWCFAGFKEV
ncbi:MAG: cytochrome P450, partial [Alphaproteobacteria bacterium]